jgi:hypothetical protein
MLKAEGIVTHCRELAPLAPKRQGWATDWLEQPLSRPVLSPS